MDSTLLHICPIAYWKKRQPKALACGPYTYEEFDRFIESIRTHLPKTSIIPFYPQKTAKDVAIFFAIWRQKKTAFPLNYRLPESARKNQIEKIQTTRNFWERVPATLIETSSASKIVAHSLSSHICSAQVAIKALNIKKNSTVCLSLPLFHVAGIATILRTFIAGAHLIFEDTMHMCTHLSLVPTQLYRLLKENRPFPHLLCLLLGGAPLSQTLKRQSHHLPLFYSYGMTETASMVFIQKPGCTVECLSHTEYKLGSDGELFLRGPTLFDHYVGETSRDPNQWFATKDIADKNLTIIGRKDRQFISGGENIQPEEIESALLHIDGVIEAKVYPEKDPEWGMRSTAQILSTQNYSEKYVQMILKDTLPSFKIPKQIKVKTNPLEWASKSTKLSQ